MEQRSYIYSITFRGVRQGGPASRTRGGAGPAEVRRRTAEGAGRNNVATDALRASDLRTGGKSGTEVAQGAECSGAQRTSPTTPRTRTACPAGSGPHRPVAPG